MSSRARKGGIKTPGETKAAPAAPVKPVEKKSKPIIKPSKEVRAEAPPKATAAPATVAPVANLGRAQVPLETPPRANATMLPGGAFGGPNGNGQPTVELKFDLKPGPGHGPLCRSVDHATGRGEVSHAAGDEARQQARAAPG